KQRVLLGHADDLGGEAEIRIADATRVAQVAQLADRGLEPGGADHGAVGVGHLAHALDAGDRGQSAQQRVAGGRAHRPAPSPAAPASAVRMASICWATPARTSPASDTTTQLSRSRLSSSTSSITPTAGCAWRTAP